MPRGVCGWREAVLMFFFEGNRGSVMGGHEAAGGWRCRVQGGDCLNGGGKGVDELQRASQRW